MTPRIPFGGRYHVPEEVKFEPTIVIVPFYKAKPNQPLRHVNFFLDLGYRVCQFDLRVLEPWRINSLFSSQNRFGMKAIWTDQIEAVLNSVPGPKIVFAFSNPSASAIEAIVRRQATDVRGLVCDSGPSGHFVNSVAQLLKAEGRLGNAAFRWAGAYALSFGWSPNFNQTIHDDLSKLPKGFKILSIRGWKDPIISPYAIDAVFEPHATLNWKKLSLPMAGHLNGLKDFADEYKPAVSQFLQTCS